MKLGKVVGIAGVVVLSLGPVSQSSGQLGAVMGNMGNMGNLFQMAGGMDGMTKLAGNFLKSSSSDSRLSGLMGNADASSVTPKLADQMCSMLGGGCKPPLSDQQISAGASKLDADQSKALTENFGTALGGMTSNPVVKEGLSKAIAPKLGGIVGALL